MSSSVNYNVFHIHVSDGTGHDHTDLTNNYSKNPMSEGSELILKGKYLTGGIYSLPRRDKKTGKIIFPIDLGNGRGIKIIFKNDKTVQEVVVRLLYLIAHPSDYKTEV